MSDLQSLCKVSGREALDIIDRAIKTLRGCAFVGDMAEEFHGMAGALEYAYIRVADLVIDAEKAAEQAAS